MKEIRVIITEEEIIKLSYLELFEMHCVYRLKESGIPAKGCFMFGGLDRGELSRTDDPMTGAIVFIWRDDETNDTRNIG